MIGGRHMDPNTEPLFGAGSVKSNGSVMGWVQSLWQDPNSSNDDKKTDNRNKYLVYGYLRPHVNLLTFPVDIFNIILSMYTYGSLYWYLNKKDIKTLSNCKNEANAMKSNIFGVGMDGISCNCYLHVNDEGYIQFCVKILNNKYKYDKLSNYKFTFYAELYCNEMKTNYKIAKKICDHDTNNYFPPYTADEDIKRVNKAEIWWNKQNMKISDVMKLNEISFGCDVEILKIETISLTTSVSTILYNKENKFSSNPIASCKLKWILPDYLLKFISSGEYVGYMRHFYSSFGSFGNNCWCLYFSPYQTRLDDRIAIGFHQLCHHDHGEMDVVINTNLGKTGSISRKWSASYNRMKLGNDNYQSFSGLKKLSWISIAININ